MGKNDKDELPLIDISDTESEDWLRTVRKQHEAARPPFPATASELNLGPPSSASETAAEAAGVPHPPKPTE